MPVPPRSEPPTRTQAAVGAPVTQSRPSAGVPTLSKIKRQFKPPRIVLNAVEGFGKTSFGAYAPNPAIIMSRGETGYESLLGAGLVPEIAGVSVDTWEESLLLLDTLADNCEFDTLILDAVSGFESMCHDHIGKREFGGDMGEQGFLSYKKGYEVSVPEWEKMLAKLDRIREKTGTTVVLLSHSKVKVFKSPLTEDFDRYISDAHEKTWAATTKWADAVLFGNFFQVVDNNKRKRGAAKGIGGNDRIIYTERRDAYDAKNRYNMPDAIELSDNPADNWGLVWKHIKPQGG